MNSNFINFKLLKSEIILGGHDLIGEALQKVLKVKDTKKSEKT